MNFKKMMRVAVGGTVAAQILPLLFSPLLTRLFTPESIGAYANFIAIATMLSMLLTLRYEVLLVSSGRLMLKRFQAAIWKLLVIAFVVQMLFFMVVNYFFHFGRESFLLPVGALAIAIGSIYFYDHASRSDINKISIYRAGAAFLISCLQVAGGLFSSGLYPLIFADFFGRIIPVFSSSRFLNGITLSKITKFDLAVFYANKRLPCFELPASLANFAAMQLPVLLFPVLFGVKEAAFYFLVYRVVMAPVSMISSAYSDVIRKTIVDKIQDYGECEKYIVNVVKQLALWAVFPVIGMFFFAEKAFLLVFGSGWSEAGVYVKLLLPLLFMKFVTSPVTFVFYARKKESLNMIGQGLLLLATLGAILIGYFFGKPAWAILSMSILCSLVYLYYLVMSIKLSKASLA